MCHCVSGMCRCVCLCLWGLQHPLVPWGKQAQSVAAGAPHFCVTSSLCLDEIYIYLFIPKRKLTTRGKHHLSLIFNTLRHSVAISRSHGPPLYLCLPVTQSGLEICHLPLRPVHRTDRILAGTRRSHPVAFPLKLCSTPK